MNYLLKGTLLVLIMSMGLLSTHGLVPLLQDRIFCALIVLLFLKVSIMMMLLYFSLSLIFFFLDTVGSDGVVTYGPSSSPALVREFTPGFEGVSVSCGYTFVSFVSLAVDLSKRGEERGVPMGDVTATRIVEYIPDVKFVNLRWNDPSLYTCTTELIPGNYSHLKLLVDSFLTEV